jgi:hypothetical protein
MPQCVTSGQGTAWSLCAVLKSLSQVFEFIMISLLLLFWRMYAPHTKTFILILILILLNNLEGWSPATLMDKLPLKVMHTASTR